MQPYHVRQDKHHRLHNTYILKVVSTCALIHAHPVLWRYAWLRWCLARAGRPTKLCQWFRVRVWLPWGRGRGISNNILSNEQIHTVRCEKKSSACPWSLVIKFFFQGTTKDDTFHFTIGELPRDWLSRVQWPTLNVREGFGETVHYQNTFDLYVRPALRPVFQSRCGYIQRAIHYK